MTEDKNSRPQDETNTNDRYWMRPDRYTAVAGAIGFTVLAVQKTPSGKIDHLNHEVARLERLKKFGQNGEVVDSTYHLNGAFGKDTTVSKFQPIASRLQETHAKIWETRAQPTVNQDVAMYGVGAAMCLGYLAWTYKKNRSMTEPDKARSETSIANSTLGKGPTP